MALGDTVAKDPDVRAKDDGDTWLLIDIVQARLARVDDRMRWLVEPGEFWCYVTTEGHKNPGQGWKLHVSATELSAPLVLARAAEVLIRADCAFKFASKMQHLGELLSNLVERGSGGKFITAYPRDDEQFRQVAAELDRVTDGLPGPVILSDRRLRPDSLVHYRFGVFGKAAVFTNDGSFELMLTGPDGQLVKDQRRAWFSPPPWAVSPLGAADDTLPTTAPTTSSTAGSGSRTGSQPAAVLVGGRFVVREAIRHSYRGGVYRGIDQDTGAEVVLKQARPHVMGSLTGEDARDALRHEAEILRQLEPLGLAPHLVALVTQQDNLFLVEESIPGATLRDWAAERATGAWRGRGAPTAVAVELAAQLVEILAAVHGQGLVLRDFTPNNLMVTPDNRIRLIDLELAVPEGSRAARAHTQGYAAPEQTSAPLFGPVPSGQADLFSLGATLVHLTSGLDPFLIADEPVPRPGLQRLEILLSRVAGHMPALDLLLPLVLGLMHDEPEQRWNLTRSRGFLASARADVVPTPRSAPPDPDALPDAVADQLLADGLNHLLRTVDLAGRRLWPAGDFGDSTDPCNVQHGAAGVLGVFTRAAAVLREEKLHQGVAAVAGWIDQRLDRIPRVLPGLYFGRSGTAWALYDAAQLLAVDHFASRALELAKRVPVQWPNPDICHGAAGAGMAQWHLWRATGDPEFERRGDEAARTVLRAAEERHGHLLWPIPSSFDSELAGLSHYGFAHGVAGAGAFLLYSGLATGKGEYLQAALRAGETLRSVAEFEGEAAWWRSGEGGEKDTRMPHWCSGSSGVGTFLIRLWSVTGEQVFRDLAESAGAAIRRDRWYSTAAACHGLAGDGEFLLDLADLTADQRYRDWAGELAAVMHAHHALRDGLMVLPDDTGSAVTAGYNTGLTGALGFLLRLRHGGPRWWMPDELLRTPDPAVDTDPTARRRVPVAAS
jgi:hypothetical protein